jgi:hypothetical protein
MQVTRRSHLTGVTRTLELDVTPEEMRAWESGTFAQVALPRLSSHEREFIITGVTKEEWDEAFKDD